MDKKRPVVLITGSSGFIGEALARDLEHDYEVVGLDLAPPRGTPAGRWVKVDLTSDESVHNAVEQVRKDFGPRLASVVHLAAYYDFSGEPSPLYEQITVRGTGRLMRSLRVFEAVEQLVFSSTMLVHAPCEPDQRINEDWPLEPKWEYPQSKLDTERLILAERGSIPVALMRIAGVYDDRCHSIPIANQIQRIYERRLTATVFPGDTSTGQSFVHLDDLVDALRSAVDRRKDLLPESVFLIGEEETLSYEELQRMLGWVLHQEEQWETTRIPKAVAKTGAWLQDKVPGVEEPFIKPWMIDLADDHYALDITRARKVLDWHPQRKLRETLRRMVESLNADPAAFYRENKLEGSPPQEAERSNTLEPPAT